MKCRLMRQIFILLMLYNASCVGCTHLLYSRVQYATHSQVHAYARICCAECTHMLAHIHTQMSFTAFDLLFNSHNTVSYACVTIQICVYT